VYALSIYTGVFSNLVTIAEEIRDASRILPIGMVWSLVVNEISGFIMLVAYIFSIDNLDDIINSTAIFPLIDVFVRKTNSVKTTTAMIILLIVLQVFATVNYVATASRQLYSFARDKGLPRSSSLSYVRMEHP
jgi:amino acid transporter